MDSQDEGQQASFDDIDNDFLWGRAEIGRAIGRTPNQIAWMMSQGLLDGAVKRVGHRSVIASKKKLKALAAKLIDPSP